MNKFVIKNIIVTSLILGLILGILAVIPFVGIIALYSLLLLTAPLVIIYLIMDGKLDLTSAKDSIISGAIAGFSANMTFSIIFSIILMIMSGLFNYSPNLFLSSMIVNSPIWLLLTFIVFVGVLTSTTNAFTGFVTYYIIEFIRDSYEKKNM